LHSLDTTIRDKGIKTLTVATTESFEYLNKPLLFFEKILYYIPRQT